MFAELVEFGKRIRTGHDALKAEKCSYDIVIDVNGNFIPPLIPCDIEVVSENIIAKKGKARLLVDKAEETLGFGTDAKKHVLYIEKLNLYQDIEILKPVFLFYENEGGCVKALEEFRSLDERKQKGNLTFRIKDDDKRLVEKDEVRTAIIEKFNNEQAKAALGQTIKCSVCGRSDYPILDEPHGSVKMPKGQTAGSMLVSYNEKAFESYGLIGNLNSGICTNCARNYIEALKYLLGNGNKTDNDKFKYTNRQNISDDTVLLYWTKANNEEIDMLYDVIEPTTERIQNIFASIVTGDTLGLRADVDNYFYSCTMSSAASRIAVRDWISISIPQYKQNIKAWFEDIATINQSGNVYYPGINQLISGCFKIKKKTDKKQSDKKAKARIGAILWRSVLTNSHLPSMLLNNVLAQIEHAIFTEEHSTLLRLIINRNIKTTYKMKESLDTENMSIAYLCGRLFALICKQQFVAQGAVNSSIKDRFFSSASNSPARVLGLLLSKYVPIYEKKTKGAYSTDIAEIAAQIQHFPNQFSALERGEFALGYYYQNKKTTNKNSK